MSEGEGEGEGNYFLHPLHLEGKQGPQSLSWVFLCGEREMIRGVTLLVDERFPGSRVYTEVFY